MKVCPYCNAIVEEANAIKCNVCGMDIHSEKEYTQEELNDENVLDTIDFHNKQKLKARKFKRILPYILLPLFLIVIFIVVFFIEPVGHINIPKNYYEIKVGERLPIEIEYSDKVSMKNLRIDLIDSYYKDLGTDEFSYYFDIENGKYVLVALKEDVLKFKFSVKDDGKQKLYNDTITIVVLKEGK